MVRRIDVDKRRVVYCGPVKILNCVAVDEVAQGWQLIVPSSNYPFVLVDSNLYFGWTL
jgi:hypothetical protein